MSLECRHGFDEGLCAQCFPPPAPEPAPEPAPAASRTRATAAKRAGTPRISAARGSGARVAAAAAADKSSTNPGELRIYRAVHVDALPAVLAAGQIEPGPLEPGELLSENYRSERSELIVGSGDASLADFVPFGLSPDYELWAGLRRRSVDARIAAAAAVCAPTEYVILVSSVKDAFEATGDDGEVLVADGDPAADGTRFATGRHEVDRNLSRLRAGDEDGTMDTAEVLVEGAFPLARVQLIAVSTAKARTAVKALLTGVANAPKVAIYPPWFQDTPAANS